MSASPELIADVKAFYADVDAAIAAHKPVCINRGLCCRFGEYGHKLYVTDVELDFFIAQRGANVLPVASGEACPYQLDGKCTAREERPLGCRIFFCDPDAQSWQPAEYERFLARLKELGRKHGVAYRYREWLSALQDAAPIHAPAEASQAAIAPITGGLGPVDGIALPVIK